MGRSIRNRPLARWLASVNVGVKVALLALLAFAVLNPTLPQFAGKAMVGRAVTFPIAVFMFIRFSDELTTAYTDTLGDLALGMSGGLVAAVLVTLVGRTSGYQSGDDLIADQT